MKLSPTISVFNDAQAAQSLLAHTKHFEGQKYLLGLHCYWIKSQIAHGEFGPWLQRHAPDLCRLKDGETPQPKKQLAEAMKFCLEATEQAGFQLSQVLQRVQQLQSAGKSPMASPAEFLLLEDASLSAEARELKNQLHRGIQLQLDFENGLKVNPKSAGPQKKLTPAQQLEEQIKNMDANTDVAIGALEIELALKVQDFAIKDRVKLKALDGLCAAYRKKFKGLKKQKAVV